MEDPSVGGIIELESILKKMKLESSGQGEVAGSCEYATGT
jgi:hypothetical protein